MPVEEWLKPEWQEMSERNKSNRDKSTIVHTTGSVPMAKWRKEEFDRDGVEPSPIECWRKFHVSKAKDGKQEHWKSDKAKEIYDDLTEKKNRVEEVFGEADDWEIYQKVIGGPSHGRVLGLGAGVKLNDYTSSNQTCNNPTCLEQKEDYERVKGQVESLTNKLEKLTQIVQSLLPTTSNNSKARNSHFVDNIATDSSAHHDEDGAEDGVDEDGADEDSANFDEEFY